MTILILLNAFALVLSIHRLCTLDIPIGHSFPTKLDQSITTKSKFELFLIDNKRPLAREKGTRIYLVTSSHVKNQLCRK